MAPPDERRVIHCDRTRLPLHPDPPREYDQRIEVPAGAVVGMAGWTALVATHGVRARLIHRDTFGRRHYQTLDLDSFPIDIWIAKEADE